MKSYYFEVLDSLDLEPVYTETVIAKNIDKAKEKFKNKNYRFYAGEEIAPGYVLEISLGGAVEI